MKKLLGIVLSCAMVFSMAACGATATTTTSTAASTESTGEAAAEGGNASDLKIGVILVGDETEGYSAAHIEGIKTAAAELGMADDQIIWKYKVEESSDCADAAEDLVGQGCQAIFSNSYGHQTYVVEVAEKYPDVTFVSMTGDFAAISGLDNFKNAFTSVYESRYVSGIVAGLKLKELTESGELTPETQPESFDADGNVKIGYVGAFSYAEVVSGYTAFFLGIQSVVENVVMDVTYTNSWFDITAEAEAANALMSSGCVVIGQHADSTGAPSAVQAAQDAGKVAYSIGYNVDMLAVAPTAALTSATNVWEVYYEYAMKAVINGEKIARNWAAGYAEGAVAITALGESCAEGTAEKVEETIAALQDGSLKVFDVTKFTVDGETVTSTFATDTDGDFVYDTDEAIIDGAYCESYYQSAPSFALRIDGITELN